MLYAYDPSLIVTVTDATGSAVIGRATDEYLKDDISGKSESDHLELLYVPKPNSGNYTLSIDNPTNNDAKLDIYFYDTLGNVWTKKLTIQDTTSTDFTLRYDRTKANKSTFDHSWHFVWQYFRQWKKWVLSWNRWGWRERD